MFGPRGMPLELREKVAADIVDAGSTKQISDRLTDTAQLVALGGPHELAKSIARQTAGLDAAARTLGMKRKL